jgi:hypothetical protein
MSSVITHGNLDAVLVAEFISTTSKKGQYLAPDNTSPNIVEGLEARIKDPLWFLARQWQTGEFEGENGGKLAQLEVTASSYPIVELQRSGEQPTPIPAHVPLQPLVESEGESESSNAWRAEALEYEFHLAAPPFRFTAERYEGEGLDWYHFDLDEQRTPRPTGFREARRIVPTNLSFPSMPHPRWWRFEDGGAHVDTLDNVEPNPLSLILPEFLIADANNWFVVPIDQRVGTAREIETVKAVDSFGAVTNVPPVSAAGDGWQMFTHTAQSSAAPGATLLLFADLGAPPIDGEPIEDVVFLRDEEANVVWAVEEVVWDSVGKTRIRFGPESSAELPPRPSEASYRLRSDVPKHWIPYVPRPIDSVGQVYLRRARSSEEFSRDNPQYRSRVVAESWMLNEEEVSRLGVDVARLWRAISGTDGRRHFWIGRRKRLVARHASAGLEYDYIEEPGE